MTTLFERRAAPVASQGFVRVHPFKVGDGTTNVDYSLVVSSTQESFWVASDTNAVIASAFSSGMP